MKRLRIFLIIIVLVCTLLVVANNHTVESRSGDGWLEAFESETVAGSKGEYKYLFYYDRYYNYNNIWCARDR